MRKNKAAAFTEDFIIFCLLLAVVSALFVFVAICVYGTHDEAERTSSEPMPTFSVIIDAGHGGEDGGAVSASGTAEKDINLEISSMLADMLRACSVNVIMTRTEDILLYDRNADYMGHKKSLDLRARLCVSRENPDALFVSVHMNSFPSTKYSGLQVYYSPNNDTSRVLAETIQTKVKLMLQPDNERKIKKAGKSIYLLDRAQGTAVLVECGFLSNADECAKLETKEYRRQVAFALFSAICAYSENCVVN